MNNPWRTKSSRVHYDNPWIQVTEHQVVQPGGADGIYGVVHFKNLAIGIVPVFPDGSTLLVGQFRYPLNEYSWEIPEGGGPRNRPPLASAQRELLEETGLMALHWHLLLRMHLSNSVSDELALVYLATGLTQHAPAPEPTEVLERRRVSVAAAVAEVRDGKITDSISVAALLRLADLSAQGAALPEDASNFLPQVA